MSTIEPDEPELDLLLKWEDESERARRREAVLISALAHVVLISALVLQAKVFPAPKRTGPPKPDRHITLLFSPPRRLTQKEPNRQPPSDLFVGETTPPRPPLMLDLKAIPSAPPPPPAPKADLAREEKPPQLTLKPEPAGSSQLAQLMPQPPPPAPPKLALESVNRPSGGRQGTPQTGVLTPQRPGSVIEGAVRDLSHGAGQGGTIVGDGAGGGVQEGFRLPAPGTAGSNLELISDPMGVDFKPYLTRILAAVRRNWYAVIPESARLGMVRGRVSIQFIIIRPGGVSKLVIAAPSGLEALDRAAVAGISASNPFPPLPSEFRGDQIKLQFTFLYNIPLNN